MPKIKEATDRQKTVMTYYAGLAKMLGFTWVWRKNGTMELTWPDLHVAELTVDEFYRYVSEWADCAHCLKTKIA